MNREEALQLVKPHLTERRYVHTLGVLEAAVELAERFKVDKKKAELAAIFHDYAKYRDVKEMQILIQQIWQDKMILYFSDELLHAPCGAFYVEKEVGIDDEEILNAIRYHTTGREDMTSLEKVIFLADYIEKGRQFPGIDEVREIAQTDLDQAVLQTLKNMISFLLKRDEAIYPKTIETYNFYVENKLKKEQ